jgi:hypothetical protein
MKNSDDLKIFVVTHEQSKRLFGNDFVYLGVGDKKTELSCDCFDSEGDNIANLNPYYCELTAQYWIYKNCNAKFVGLVHYRRMFYHHLISPFHYFFYSRKQLRSILDKYDAIITTRYYVHSGGFRDVAEEYSANHRKSDLDNIGKIIQQFYPAYYSAFLSVMGSKRISGCNMLITSKTIYDDYSSFLFGVLFRLQSMINFNDLIGPQKRIFGYLGERLLNVYFEKNKDLKVKRLHACLTSRPCFKQYLSDF